MSGAFSRPKFSPFLDWRGFLCAFVCGIMIYPQDARGHMTKQIDILTYKYPRTLEGALDIPEEDWTLYEIAAAFACIVVMGFICFVVIVWG